MEYQKIVARPAGWKSPCIDCSKPARGERCRLCERIRRNGGPLNQCVCGTVIRKQHKRCRPCAGTSARPHMVKPHNIAFCKGCGAFLKIEGSHKQKRCQTCAPKVEEVRARRSAAMKKRFADPAYRAQALARLAKARSLINQDLIDRSKQAKSLSDSRMAWCPDEYRDYYKRLRSRQVFDRATRKWIKVGAKAARARIEKSFGGPLRPLSLTTADVSLHQCRVDGKVVKLGAVQLTILLHLIGRDPKRYVSTEELIRLIWPNPNMEPEGGAGQTVGSHMHHLRRKGICIVSIQGAGYRIAPQVRSNLS